MNRRRKLQPISNEIDFLGYIVRRNYILVRRRVINNLKAGLRRFERLLVHKRLGREKTGSELFLAKGGLCLPVAAQAGSLKRICRPFGKEGLNRNEYLPREFTPAGDFLIPPGVVYA